MSSINRSAKGDEVTRLKEYYSQKEIDKEKAHQETINTLNHDHSAQIAKVQAQSKDEIEQIRNRSHEKFSEKEIQYQKEIDSIKSLYQKKIEEAGR